MKKLSHKKKQVKKLREVVLNLTDGESLTKSQLLEQIEPLLQEEVKEFAGPKKFTLPRELVNGYFELFMNQELEKLRREGEIYFPKEGVIQRIG